MEYSTTEIEHTRVARFAAMPGRTDIFNVQAFMPDTGLLVRKVIGRGIVKDQTKKSAIEIEHPFSMTFVEIPPGQGAPLHAHSTEEVFFIVEGEMTFYWGERKANEIVLGKYDTLTMPVHVFRGFVNRSDKTARMMVTVAGTAEQTTNSVTHPPEIVAMAAAAGMVID